MFIHQDKKTRVFIIALAMLAAHGFANVYGMEDKKRNFDFLTGLRKKKILPKKRNDKLEEQASLIHNAQGEDEQESKETANISLSYNPNIDSLIREIDFLEKIVEAGGTEFEYPSKVEKTGFPLVFRLFDCVSKIRSLLSEIDKNTDTNIQLLHRRAETLFDIVMETESIRSKIDFNKKLFLLTPIEYAKHFNMDYIVKKLQPYKKVK
jgi:hypothetical protein